MQRTGEDSTELETISIAKPLHAPQFWANFEFWGLLYQLPFTDKAQIWCPEADRTSTLMCQILSESVHCVGFQWPKTTILGKF